MENILVLLLLCSGFSYFSEIGARRLRFFSVDDSTTKRTWDGARQFCNNKNEYLVTLYDAEDVDFALKYFGQRKRFWLGLRIDDNAKWSDGMELDYDELEDVVDGNVGCLARENGTWNVSDCSEKKRFMCKKNREFSLSNSSGSWCEALQLCRTVLNADLASIEDEDREVIETGNNNTSFWVGLMGGRWEDGGCSEFTRRVYPDLRSQSSKCLGIKFPADRNWPKTALQNCDQCALTFCSTGTVRIRIVQEPRTWEQALDYCEEKHSGILTVEDQEDQDAVEQWLENANFSTKQQLFWIGLRQSRMFGFWILKDRVANFANWFNDEAPEPDMSYRCGAIDRTDFRWRGLSCLEPKPFLCQEDIVFVDENPQTNSPNPPNTENTCGAS